MENEHKLSKGVSRLNYFHLGLSLSLSLDHNDYFVFLLANETASPFYLMKIAAKAGAKAGASLGINEAQKSGARAGAMAGAAAGQKAGAEAGAEAAAKAATEVATKALKEALEKLGTFNKPVGILCPHINEYLQ